jgi:hypothetical protein
MQMSRRGFKAEEIVNKLREADVAIAQGRTVAQVSKQTGVTKQTDGEGLTLIQALMRCNYQYLVLRSGLGFHCTHTECLLRLIIRP